MFVDNLLLKRKVCVIYLWISRITLWTTSKTRLFNVNKNVAKYKKIKVLECKNNSNTFKLI